MKANITGGCMATLSDYTEPVSSTAVKWSQHDWQEHLQAPGRRLVELHALTENSFLLIGESLQDFYSRAGKVSAAADCISADLLGPDSAERLTRLQLLVERMSIFLAEIKKSSQHNEKSLQEICTALKRLKDPLKSFQKITKTLQVIGVTTRVECSDHVESGSANGSVLSDSLRRLAALISGNMAAIVDQVALLHNLSEEALKNESALNNGQSSRATVAVEHARAVLVELGVNHDNAAGKSESLAQCSTGISSSIGEIVSSLQFHDITRQQIEHVSQTIDALGQEVARSFSLEDKPQQQVIELAVAEGCRLQSEQLEHARNELSAAVWRIIESLHSLSNSVTELAKDTCALAGATEKDGATFFSALEPAIESVSSILVENAETAAKSLQAVVNVVCAAEEMSELVVEIERFGAEMKVLALNASVEAVHAKKGGEALNVIADSIQNLANEALLQTEALAGSLKEITHYAESLGGSDIGLTLGKSKEVNKLTSDADKLLGELYERNNGLSGSLSLIEKSSGTLAVDVAETAASIRIHDEINVILKSSIDDLLLIIDRFPASEEIWQKVQHIPLFREMHNRYSMKSERDIHLRVLHEDVDQSVSENSNDSKFADKNDQKSDDFGSNVELF